MNTAILTRNKIRVIHSVRVDVNREFVQISVPNGWDDVKKLTNRVLTYDGRDFTYSGWNSDRNECYFYRMLNYQHAVNSKSRVAIIK